jgi:PAS domain S-box-containing protein
MTEARLFSTLFSRVLAPECRLGLGRLLKEAYAGKVINKASVILGTGGEDNFKSEGSFRLVKSLDVYGDCLVGVLRNETHHQKQERVNETQAQQMKFYHDLINNLPAIVFYKNERGVYQECNLAMVEFLSKTRDAIIGETDAVVFSSESATVIKYHEDKLKTSDNYLLYQVKLLRGDEQMRDFLVCETAIRDVSGEIVGLSGVMMDITEELVARINLETKLTELTKINKLLVGRELKMIELKKQLKTFENKTKKSYVQNKSKK